MMGLLLVSRGEKRYCDSTCQSRLGQQDSARRRPPRRRASEARCSSTSCWSGTCSCTRGTSGRTFATSSSPSSSRTSKAPAGRVPSLNLAESEGGTAALRCVCPSRFSGRHGFVVAITGVEDIGKGLIREGTGYVTFPVKYQSVVFRPFKGEILEAVVTMVNKVDPLASFPPVVLGLCLVSSNLE
jgi:hypothetical protein